MKTKRLRLEELQAKEKESSEKQNQLATAHGTLVQSIQFSEEKCEELKAANEEQKQKEAKLVDKLHGLLDDVDCTVHTLRFFRSMPYRLKKY